MSDGKNEWIDEEDNNGLILCNKYFIPKELILKIMCYYADEKVLLDCQQVCKCWNILMVDYVWRKKAEIKSGIKFSTSDYNLNWKDYYLIYSKDLFTKNLLKNSSGEKGLQEHWQIIQDGGDGWLIENPPIGVPPLQHTQHCFVTSYSSCSKTQTIDLIKAGFSENILDNMQPSVEISEWYSSRWDCPAVYFIEVGLKDKSDKTIKRFTFRDLLVGGKQNMWHNIKHEFKNCGSGLREIYFRHGGHDRRFWAGHYGSKMAAAYVKVNVSTSDVPSTSNS